MTQTISIGPDITMRDLLEVYPGAQRALFKKYHIGGCSSCGFKPEETLGGVCARNDDLPVTEVIEYLRKSQDEDLKTQVTVSDLAREMETATVKLVDIRTREEFDSARIEGSLLFTQELMREMLSLWNRDEAVVMIDHQGARSMDATAYFAGHGFTNIRSLLGGVDAWSAEVDPSIPRYTLE